MQFRLVVRHEVKVRVAISIVQKKMSSPFFNRTTKNHLRKIKYKLENSFFLAPASTITQNYNKRAQDFSNSAARPENSEKLIKIRCGIL